MIRRVGEVKSIVCLHLNQIGDLLFSLPALYALRQRYPDAHIASVVRPGCAGLLDRTRLVDEIIPRPQKGLSGDLSLGLQLRKSHFDLLVLFSTSPGTWVMAQVSGSVIKAGFRDSFNGFLLDIVAPWSPPPSTANDLQLAKSIGCDLVKEDYVGLITVSEEDRCSAETVLNEAGISAGEKFAVIGPGTSSGRESKAWTDEGYAGVADRSSKELGFRSVVVGVGGGAGICDRTESAIDLTGKTSLTVLAAILQRASVFIGVDSGAMHLAAVMRTPVVALFGPTNPDISGPQGEGHVIVSNKAACAPCYRGSCDDPFCMKNISVIDVVDAVIGLVSG